MLSFCINHLSPANEFVYDRESHQCYLVIAKNGSRSLNQLVHEDPLRFKYFLGHDATQFYQENNITKLVVFVRDPIERFFSGLMTQSKIYKFDINAVLNVWKNGIYNYTLPSIQMFDEHTVPQFWHLLRITKVPNLKFNIMPLEHLSLIYPNSKKLNVGTKFDFSRVSTDVMNKIDYYLTEDIVLYSQFQNQTVDLESIVAKIRLEKKFTEEYQSYYKMLTYL